MFILLLVCDEVLCVRLPQNMLLKIEFFTVTCTNIAVYHSLSKLYTDFLFENILHHIKQGHTRIFFPAFNCNVDTRLFGLRTYVRLCLFVNVTR